MSNPDSPPYQKLESLLQQNLPLILLDSIVYKTNIVNAIRSAACMGIPIVCISRIDPENMADNPHYVQDWWIKIDGHYCLKGKIYKEISDKAIHYDKLIHVFINIDPHRVLSLALKYQHQPVFCETPRSIIPEAPITLAEEWEPRPNSLLIFGSERKGVSPELMELAINSPSPSAPQFLSIKGYYADIFNVSTCINMILTLYRLKIKAYFPITDPQKHHCVNLHPSSHQKK